MFDNQCSHNFQIIIGENDNFFPNSHAILSESPGASSTQRGLKVTISLSSTMDADPQQLVTQASSHIEQDIRPSWITFKKIIP